MGAPHLHCGVRAATMLLVLAVGLARAELQGNDTGLGDDSASAVHGGPSPSELSHADEWLLDAKGHTKAGSAHRAISALVLAQAARPHPRLRRNAQSANPVLAATKEELVAQFGQDIGSFVAGFVVGVTSKLFSGEPVGDCLALVVDLYNFAVATVRLFERIPSKTNDPLARCSIQYHDCIKQPKYANDPDLEEAECLKSQTGWCGCIGFTSNCELPKTVYQSLVQTFAGTQQLGPGKFFPLNSETAVSGAIQGKIARSSAPNSRFTRDLVHSALHTVDYATADSRFMTARLEEAIQRIATVVSIESDGVERLVVKKAWVSGIDSSISSNSLHYEGRAAQLTTYAPPPYTTTTAGELSSIAIASGFPSWVLRESDGSGGEHIHISVPDGLPQAQTTKARSPEYTQSLQEWNKEFASHLLDGVKDIGEGLLACLLGVDVSNIPAQAANAALDKAQEALVAKVGRKIIKFGKVALKIGGRVIPVARVITGAVKIGKVVIWYMAEGGEYIATIRREWAAKPPNYFKVGNAAGNLFGAALAAFDKDNSLRSRLTGAKSRRRRALPLVETWAPLQYTNGSDAPSGFWYNGVASRRYSYSSRLITRLSEANGTDHGSKSTVYFNCSLTLTPLEHLLAGPHEDPYVVLRVEIADATVAVSSHEGEGFEVEHTAVHGSFLAIQHANGTIVGVSAPSDHSLEVFSSQQRLVHLLSLNLGTGERRECDFRGCRLVDVVSTAPVNASFALVSRSSGAREAPPDDGPQYSDPHSVVATFRPTPRTLDGQGHVVAVVDLETSSVESIVASSYERTAFLATSYNANATAASTEVESEQRLTSVEVLRRTGAARLPEVRFASLAEAMAQRHLHPDNAAAMGLPLGGAPHILHTDHIPPPPAHASEQNAVGDNSTLVEGVIEEAVSEASTEARGAALLNDLPRSDAVVGFECSWARDAIALGRFEDSRDRLYNALARTGTVRAQLCLVELAALGTVADTSRILNAFVQLAQTPTGEVLAWTRSLVDTDVMAGQVYGVFAAHALAAGNDALADRITADCLAQRNAAEAGGDYDRVAEISMMCLRHTGHPDAAAALVAMLDHGDVEVQKAAVLGLQAAPEDIRVEVALANKLDDPAFEHKGAIVRTLHRREQARQRHAGADASQYDRQRHHEDGHRFTEAQHALRNNASRAVEEAAESGALDRQLAAVNSASAASEAGSGAYDGHGNGTAGERGRRASVDISYRSGKFSVKIADYLEMVKTFGGNDLFAEAVVGVGYFTGFNQQGFFISVTGGLDVNVVLWGNAIRLAYAELAYANEHGGDLVAGHFTLNVANLLHIHKSFTKAKPDGDSLSGGTSGSISTAGGAQRRSADEELERRRRLASCFPLFKHTLIDKTWEFGQLTLPPVLVWPAPPILASAYIGASAKFSAGFNLKACLPELTATAATAPAFGVTVFGGISVSIAKVAEVSMRVDVTIFKSTLTAEYAVKLHTQPKFFVKGCFDVVQNSQAFSGSASVRLRILCIPLTGICLFDGSKTIARWASTPSRKVLLTTCPKAQAPDDVYDVNKQETVDPPAVLIAVSPLRARFDQRTTVTFTLKADTAPLSSSQPLCKFGEANVALARRISRTVYECDTPIAAHVDKVWAQLCLGDLPCAAYSTAQFELYTLVTAVTPGAYPAGQSTILTITAPGSLASGVECIFGDCASCIGPATSIGPGRLTCASDVHDKAGHVDLKLRMRLPSGLVTIAGLSSNITLGNGTSSFGGATNSSTLYRYERGSGNSTFPTGTVTGDTPVISIFGAYPPSQPQLTPTCRVGNMNVGATLVSTGELRCDALPLLTTAARDLPVSISIDGRTITRTTVGFRVVDFLPVVAATPNVGSLSRSPTVVVEGGFFPLHRSKVDARLRCVLGDPAKGATWATRAVQTSSLHVLCPGVRPNATGNYPLSIAIAGREKPIGVHAGDHIMFSVVDYGSISPKVVQPWGQPTLLTVHGGGFPRNGSCTCMFGNLLSHSLSITAADKVQCPVPAQPAGTYKFSLACEHSGWGNAFLSIDYAPKGCPEPTCSNNGQCNNETGHCHCFSGYGGSGCAGRTCPGDCSGGRGSCNTATGVCRCTPPFAGSGCADRIGPPTLDRDVFLFGTPTNIVVTADYLPRDGRQATLVCVFVVAGASAGGVQAAEVGVSTAQRLSPRSYSCPFARPPAATSAPWRFRVGLALDDNRLATDPSGPSWALLRGVTLDSVSPLEVFAGSEAPVTLTFSNAVDGASVMCSWTGPTRTPVPAFPTDDPRKVTCATPSLSAVGQQMALFSGFRTSLREDSGRVIAFVARPCPGNCTNPEQGTCNPLTGVCQCAPTHYGESCSLRRCLNDCSERGECHDGTCTCDYGFAGRDCSALAMCAVGCPLTWATDDSCDAACNNEVCAFDGGACKSGCPCPSYYIGDGFCDAPKCLSCDGEANDCVADLRCAPGCPTGFSGDGACDQGCNVEACEFDGGDCPAALDEGCPANACPLALRGNGRCDPGCNRAECGFDDDDCVPLEEVSLVELCAPGCLPELLNNGACDPACASCAEELSVCEGSMLPGFGNGVVSPTSSPNETGAVEVPVGATFCDVAELCPESWLGDGVCDGFCDQFACGFDAGDCGGCATHSGAALGCHVQAECIDTTAGGMACECKDGYTGDGRRACVEVDECLTATCGANERCVDEVAGFACVCKDGFVFDASNTACVNVDECASPVDRDCHPAAACTDTEGSHTCQCRVGYAGDGLTCSYQGCPQPCAANASCVLRGFLPSCECDAGFYLSASGACQDVDECVQASTVVDLCPMHTVCANTVGSFVCEPLPGYQWRVTNVSVVDVDECRQTGGQAVCDPSATCVNTPGHYTCSCAEGQLSDGAGACLDEDECAAGSLEVCGLHAVCANRALGFECLCDAGYVRDPTVGLCVDEDECVVGSPCHHHATCQNTEGGFRCACKPHFAGDGVQSCAAIQPCSATRPCSAHATCQSTDGAMVCLCDAGWVEDPVTGMCTDVDECAAATPACPSTAVCRNLPGSVRCDCLPGWTGADCSLDVDECAAAPCGPNAKCHNTPGSHDCWCLVGYARPPGQPTGACADVDECATDARACHPNATCSNTIGGYWCTCDAGFEGDGRISCEEVNPCELAGACPKANEECRQQSAAPYYSCGCTAGYTRGPAGNCTDIDECAAPAPASGPLCNTSGYTCANTPGAYVCTCANGTVGFESDAVACSTTTSCFADAAFQVYRCDPIGGDCVGDLGQAYRCECVAGFTGDGFACTDVDECALGLHNCSTDATCSNTVGAFSCTCNPGYEGSGYSCSDVDECARGLDDCDADATCSNAVGSFTCACNAGYRGDGRTCRDVDECAEDSDDCSAQAACTNTVGSFSCACSPGFTGDGRTCHDVDECAGHLDSCHADAACTNTFGGYTCACKAGFTGDGFSCANIDECATGGHDCDARAACADTYGAWQCTCNAGFAGTGQQCVDVDECAQGLDACSASATCTNTVGQYTCACKAGFTGDGFSCVNVDECLEGTHDCHGQATCSDTHGAWQCACIRGYAGTGQQCVDVDECLNPRTCHADAVCTNSIGGFSCHCKTHFDGDGFACVPHDECANAAENQCDAVSSRCVNLRADTYECVCRAPAFAGPTVKGQASVCSDVDECTAGSHTCDTTTSTCRNTHGAFVCVCGSGFEPVPGQLNRCRDIDECATSPCGATGVCTNTKGSYECSCAAGWLKTPGQERNPKALCTVCVSNTLCGSRGTCNAAAGGVCTCDFGFLPAGIGAARCAQCSDALLCNSKGACDAAIGRCTCQAGWTKRVDCSQCDSATLCGVNGRCDGDDGSGSCTSCGACVCDANYRGPTCALRCPVDSAGLTCGGQGTCDAAAVCQCNPGYELGPGGVCVDIKECSSSDPAVNTCDPARAVCHEMTGSHRCTCLGGYSGSGRRGQCSDINECASNVCPQACTNLNPPQRYRCSCYSGYSGDGNTCRDINECITGRHTCWGSARCINSAGSYSCQCPPGYTGNGRSCTACGSGTYKNGYGSGSCSSCPSGSTHLGSGATTAVACQCSAGYEGSGSSSCSLCGRGKLKTTLGNGACSACPAGSTTTSLGARTFSQCLCGPGYFGAISRSTSTCAPCPANTYKVLAGSGSCTACPRDSVSSLGALSSSQCLCKPGFTRSGSSCKRCPTNTYKSASGNGACTACSGGRVTQSTGSDSVLDCVCEPGEYLSTSGVCTRCPRSTYSSRHGTASTCTPCPYSKISYSTGLTSASQCICPFSYYQSQCQRKCLSYLTSASCSGTDRCCNSRGSCSSNGDCVCNVGKWYGTNCDQCSSAYCGEKCDLNCYSCTKQTYLNFDLNPDGQDTIYFKDRYAYVQHVKNANPTELKVNGVKRSLSFPRSGSKSYNSYHYVSLGQWRNRMAITGGTADGKSWTITGGTSAKATVRSCKSCWLVARCCDDVVVYASIVQHPSSTNGYTVGISVNANNKRGRVAMNIRLGACDPR